MEVAKSLQDDIMKIQNELMTAIQNHQVLIQRQRVNPTESIKTQIEEVQRHIICLGESQKLLVTRLRNDFESQSMRINNTHKPTLHQRYYSKSVTENDRFNNKPKTQDLSRSILIKTISSRERSLLKKNLHRNTSDSDNIIDQKSLFLKEWQPLGDSSSEENRTPCESPINGKSEENDQQRSVKRSLAESNCNVSKRPKSTLQATPRPSSPVPVRTKDLNALSSSSEESLDSLISQQPESENKIDFALALGLITNEVYSKVIKKKSERRKRRVSSQHHLYNDLWDLTVKRNRVKETEPEDTENVSRDCISPQSNSDNLCFICRRPGDLHECRVCQTGCHMSCVATEVCPACTHQTWPTPVNPVVSEKKKELEQLKINRKELIKSKTKLQEKAKLLSASLVMQTATVNQLVTKEERIHESIKKVTDFLAFIQGSQKLNS